jgi:hypothetical protein
MYADLSAHGADQPGRPLRTRSRLRGLGRHQVDELEPQTTDYQERTSRPIPVLVLEPA